MVPVLVLPSKVVVLLLLYVPSSKAESERTRPQHQLAYVIMVDIVL